MRGRLAPSPSGDLHLGHARSFLLAWWQARSQGGEIILRMEDLDADRCVEGAEQSVLEDLHWLGIDWDGEIVRQSDRLQLYEDALTKLWSDGHLYPCTCTRKELAEAASAPHPTETPQGPGGAEPGLYPGTCRGRFDSREAAMEATGRGAAWRMKIPPGECSFRDGIWGDYVEDVSATVGDFPVTTKDGRAAYQLAVVVDDADQGVDHVLRGDDLLSSTARQIHLQRALGLPSPAWYHVPLVIDGTGQRLAKRHDSLSLRRLREGGWKASEVLSWVASSVGLDGVSRATASDWLEDFRLESLPQGAVIGPVS
ncbi:MAG: tRNA glutamyl-Q(34) synthetase GluQRS [bacterium]